MRTIPLAVAFAASATLAVPSALAGWHAEQTHTSGKSGPRKADVYYEAHKLRIEAEGEPSILLDLEKGTFTMIDHEKKAHGTASLEELVAMRDEMMAQMRAQLGRMPEEMRAEMSRRLDEAEKAAKVPVVPKKTGKSETVNGMKCDVFTWTSPAGNAEACVASKLPVDMGPFKKDALALNAKLAKKGAGSASNALAFLQLADHGFPLRTKESMSQGQVSVDTMSEVTKIEKATVPADKLSPPKDYAKKTFRELVGGPPGGQ